MEIIKEIDEYLKNNMSQKRYIHSVGVMNKAKELANKHNIDEEKAMVVGLAHVIAKELNAKEINNYIQKYNIEVDEIEQKNLGLLHGKIGAKICRDKYNFTKDMQNAIEYHTLGHVNMDKLAKIVYIADKIEDNRKGKDLKYLNELAQKDLDKTMLYLLDTTIVINIKRHKLIHPQSILTRNNLLSK